MNTAIQIRGISKRYRVGTKTERADTLVSSLTNSIKVPLHRARLVRNLTRFDGSQSEDVFWALKDIDFDVEEGEIVGIVGHNGAGKSTLLKILSRITQPTAGVIDMYGRIGSLLEVGTGFHPELSGRENVFLNGAILGMSKVEIQRKFDEIVSFSGVERHLDTPVKRYSSGMKVRLAFAVAAHLEPEILLIDEVLAVGDAQFQKKCLGKMGQAARTGRTVLFVSHDMTAVQALCKRTVLLNKGMVDSIGETPEVLRKYLSSSDFNGSERSFDRPDTGDVLVLKRARIKDSEGKLRADFTNHEPIRIEADILVREWHSTFKVGIELETELGVKIFRSFHNDVEHMPNRLEPDTEYTFSMTVPAGLLNSGQVAVNIVSTEHKRRWIFVEDRAMRLNVRFQVQSDLLLESSRPGLVAPMLPWSLEPVGVPLALNGVSA